MIPCANPRAQYAAHRGEIDAAIARVLDGGRYILGDETEAFEREFAAYIGVDHAVAVGSGTEALHIAMRALGIGTGDEVITVSHTAVATVAAVELCGATPVLVDVDSDSLTIDPAEIEAAISRKTKAIVPVHLYGQPAELAAVCDIAARHGLRVIEDCAQSVGARYRERRTGSWGDVGCYSFYPTKNLGALGDGGMVVTSSSEVAQQARMLREYGWRQRYVSSIAGWNTRLDELQSAVLRVKLRHLDSDNNRRLQLARRYDDSLRNSGLRLPCCKANRTHVYHLYVVRSTRRDALREFLRQRDVGTMIHYPVPVHRQPAYADRLSSSRDLSESERAADEVLSLPMFPELTDSDADSVVEAVLAFRREGA